MPVHPPRIIPSASIRPWNLSWAGLLVSAAYPVHAAPPLPALPANTVVSHKGWQYASYYNAARQVCVARRKLPSGTWQILELKDYTQSENDSHNTISLGICPQDGTLHLAFDHHDTDLHYRKSVAGLASHPDSSAWDATRFDVLIRADSMVAGGTRKPFHTPFWRDEAGKWTRVNTRIPSGSPTGDRGRILFDKDGNAYALPPGFRIASASAAQKWTDWTVTYSPNSTVRFSGRKLLGWLLPGL